MCVSINYLITNFNDSMIKQLILLSCLTAVTQLSLAAVVKPKSSCQNSQSTNDFNSTRHSFILLGATGDLSKIEIYPSLWYLYRDNLLPNQTKIFGYVRGNRTIAEIRKGVDPIAKVEANEKQRYDEFWSKLNVIVSGNGNEDKDYEKINKVVENYENSGKGNRLFYLAIPPAVFPNATSQIKRVGMAKNGWTRIVIEKPFGRDSKSAQQLTKHLSKLFTEDQIYRIDHFLNYEMVQNIFTLRFANRIFTPAWNNKNIAAIEIDLKENFGVEGRGAFYDSNGMIRDDVENHLLQIMSLIAMERPKSNNPDDIRDAKVKLLKATRIINIKDVVLGQYVGNPDSKDPRERIGYRDDPTVPKNSITPTFSLTVLKVDNKRWKGVPFILRAGKGMKINQTQIVIQFKDVEKGLFNKQPKRNELILIAKGDEGIKVKLTSKVPGYTDDIEDITLDFKYSEAHKGFRIPGPYEKSILDVFCGSQLHFVRKDEVKEAWRIFTPILHKIEKKKIRPIEYKYGSTGPTEADEMEKRYNFLRQ